MEDYLNVNLNLEEKKVTKVTLSVQNSNQSAAQTDITERSHSSLQETFRTLRMPAFDPRVSEKTERQNLASFILKHQGQHTYEVLINKYVDGRRLTNEEKNIINKFRNLKLSQDSLNNPSLNKSSILSKSDIDFNKSDSKKNFNPSQSYESMNLNNLLNNGQSFDDAIDQEINNENVQVNSQIHNQRIQSKQSKQTKINKPVTDFKSKEKDSLDEIQEEQENDSGCLSIIGF